jgi:hypothetical protein
MHTLITHAAAPGPHCQDALYRLELPHLAQLMRLLTPGPQWHGAATDLTPLHERVLAQQQGLEGPDGLLPWAAQEAHRLGLDTRHGADGWAWITPCHWKVNADHVAMDDPVHLGLTPKDCEALRLAMQPYFAEDGITLFAHAAGQSNTRWLAHGAVFNRLPTASLDRVAGQTVDSWMPRQEQAKPLRRLQNEMQMLLYTHAVNDQRAAFRLKPVNAFWAGGTGTLASTGQLTSETHPAGDNIQVRDSLRTAALQDDAAAWATAWQALDNATLAHDLQRLRAGESVYITLCGESRAVTLEPQPLALLERVRRRFAPTQPRELLKTL